MQARVAQKSNDQIYARNQRVNNLTLFMLILFVSLSIAPNAGAGPITIESTVFICDGRMDGESCGGDYIFNLTVPSAPAATGPGIVGARFFGNFESKDASVGVTSSLFPTLSVRLFSVGDSGPNYDTVVVEPDLSFGGLMVPAVFINSFGGNTVAAASLNVSDDVTSRDLEVGERAFVTLTVTYGTSTKLPTPVTLILLLVGVPLLLHRRL